MDFELADAGLAELAAPFAGFELGVDVPPPEAPVVPAGAPRRVC
ncbi:MAG: hypothetical protein R2709_10755 [Marmoricola sp.]